MPTDGKFCLATSDPTSRTIPETPEPINTWQSHLNGMAAAAAQTCPDVQVIKGASFNFYEDFILDQGEGEALPHI